MKRGIVWIIITVIMLISLFLTSCASSATTSTTPPTTSTSQPTTKTTSVSTAPSTTTTAKVTTTSSTTTTGNWWDKLGKPQYGGTFTFRILSNVTQFDPHMSTSLIDVNAWMEKLFTDKWTLDPQVFAYNIGFRPNDYVTGLLAASYEFTDPGTFVVHLRQGVHWQDISPANGREFTSADVVFHYNRLCGFGDGYTTFFPFADGRYRDLISVTATDKYTVVFKWDLTNPEFILEVMQSEVADGWMESPDAVKLWGDVTDWHHAIGTGPYIMNDYVSGSSVTLVKNPNYWGYDERYPQNKLPYIDTIKILIIPDGATALAGLRTGKIDAIERLPLTTAQLVQKTNPQILQIPVPLGNGITVDMRDDKTPFSDIRVRKAMQAAINLPEIASSFYGGGTLPKPIDLTSYYMTGWGFPYDQWPQDLKDQYAYNPTAAKQLLAAAGYPNGFKTDVVADSVSDLDLLQIIKSYFAAVGIDMEIRPMDTASLINLVQTQKKYDQLAYRQSGSQGLSSDPIRQLTLFRTGAPQNFQMFSDPVFDALYTKALAATTIDQVKQILRDANEYLSRQNFTICLLQPNVYTLYQPWFKGFTGQDGLLNASPLNLFFYSARIWIDQDLKKSMGY